MTSERLKEAVALARQGDKDGARHILAEIIRDDVHNEMAWLWYADAMPTADAKIQALRECLYHIPDSEAARRGLERLGAHLETVPAAGPPLPREEPEPEPEPEPPPSRIPRAEPAAEGTPVISEPRREVRPSQRIVAPETGRPPLGLRVVEYLVAALIGAIVLGYIGLLVAGFAVRSFSDLQGAVADTTGLVALVVGLAIGAIVGILIVRGILTRPRTAG